MGFHLWAPTPPRPQALCRLDSWSALGLGRGLGLGQELRELRHPGLHREEGGEGLGAGGEPLLSGA
eukprot:9041130-Alexandrium_andersonii.AAC.1